MLLKIDTIKVNDRLREVSEDKVTEIASSIKEIGLLNPITVSENNELIAGYHRLKAFQMLGFTDIEVNVVKLSGLKQELAEIDENLIRHDLHYIDRGDHLKRRKEIYEVLHPETVKGYSQAIGMNKSIGNDVTSESAPTFVEDTSKKMGVCETVIKEEIRMANNLSPEIKERVKQADLSKTDALKIARLQPEKQKQVMEIVIEDNVTPKEALKEIYKEELKEARKQQQISKTEALPEDKFNVILADPPWRYDFSSTENREIENQYPTMEVYDICNLKVPSDNDSILFMWATAPKLREAFKVLDAWGFEYKTNAVWDKQKIGMGYYFRGQHELLLVATKGNPGTPDASVRPSSVISEARTTHSTKPTIIYDLIEKMYPGRKYLEMFARNERKGWKSWGNQV